MGFLPALGMALLGGITGNINNKAANQNELNAQNNAFSQTNQAGQKATGALNQFWNNNPFYKMQAPNAPQAVSAQGAPTLQAPPPPGQGGQQGGPPQLPPALMQALMQARQGGGTQSQGGQPNGMPQSGQVSFPQAPPSQGAPQANLQALLSQMYGQH